MDRTHLTLILLACHIVIATHPAEGALSAHQGDRCSYRESTDLFAPIHG